MSSHVKASPTARRLAEELGLQLEELRGTGPGGRIVKRDVLAAPRPSVEEQPASPDGRRGTASVETLSRVQRTVARRMAESKATAPEFVVETDVEMDEVAAMRRQLQSTAGESPPAPSFNDFVIKASASALRSFPRANGSYRDGSFELYSRVNVGFAVSAEDALLVPTVFDADAKTLREIARETRALAVRVREGTITAPELSGATFTVSNLGMFRLASFTAVINPPQAAILAVGAMTPTAVVRSGEVTVRTMMRLTLTCDHRILYGADAAQFLERIRELLEQPLELAL